MNAHRGSARPNGMRPFDREAYDRLKLPRRLGETIAAWDDPTFVPAMAAEHMRPDDLVLGVTVGGRSRAYPIWLIDHYHVVNDRLDERRFIVTSCERCGSGSAFLADPPGLSAREPLFRAGGLLNAALLLIDTRSGSHWLHFEGVGLDRRAEGLRLPSIPTFLMEWTHWCRLHPDSQVWSPPEDPRHPDARHGHGREEFFGRPGMEPALLETMAGPYDTSYPENEMVLGTSGDGWAAAFPLREVQTDGGVVHHPSPSGAIVVFAGPRRDGLTMAAFVPAARGRALTFDRVDDGFVDRETGSAWTIEGTATAGPLVGERLVALPWSYVRWHAWVNWHPTTTLFRSERGHPRYADVAPGIVPVEHEDILDRLAVAGYDIRVVGPVVTQRRPRRSTSSLEVQIDGDPVIIHAFIDEAAATDHESLRSAWSAFPIRSKVLETRVRRLGRFTLEARPVLRFLDPAQIVPLPWSELRWPGAFDSGVLNDLAASRADGPPSLTVGFSDVLRSLRSSGYDIVDVAFLPPGQLRVGAIDGIALTVEADRMLLYLFDDASLAEAYAAAQGHAIAFGRFVIRSTPSNMYVDTVAEILYAGDDRISWSPLLNEAGFRDAMLRATADGSAHDQVILDPADV